MGYFGNLNLEKQYEEENIKRTSEKLTKENLIHIILTMDSSENKEELENKSVHELQMIKNKLDSQLEQEYFKKYGQKSQKRLYEYDDEEIEETEGFLR